MAETGSTGTPAGISACRLVELLGTNDIDDLAEALATLRIVETARVVVSQLQCRQAARQGADRKVPLATGSKRRL